MLKIKEICTIVKGNGSGGTRYTKEQATFLPLLTPSCLNEGLLDESRLHGVDILKIKIDKEKYLAHAGDILIAESDKGMRVLYIPLGCYAYTSHCFKVVPNEEKVRPFYLLHILKYLQTFSAEYTYGTLRAHIDIKKLRNIEVPVPSLEEQDKICERLNRLVKFEELRPKVIKKLDLLKERYLLYCQKFFQISQ